MEHPDKKKYNQVQGVPVIACSLDLGDQIVSAELLAVPRVGEKVLYPGNSYERQAYCVRAVEHVIAPHGTVEIVIRLVAW